MVSKKPHGSDVSEAQFETELNKNASDSFLIDKNPNTREKKLQILQHFSNGESTVYGIKINSVDSRHLYRLTSELSQEHFLYTISSSIYRKPNTKKIHKRKTPLKIKNVYGLTFKGFLASLAFSNINDHYFIKSFQSSLTGIKLKRLAISHVTSNVDYFLAYNALRGFLLDKMNDIHWWSTNFENHSGLSKSQIEKLTLLKNKKNNDWNKLNKYLLSKYDGHELSEVTLYVKNWSDSINMISQKFSFMNILHHLKSRQKNKSFETEILPPISITDDGDFGGELCRIKTLLDVSSDSF